MNAEESQKFDDSSAVDLIGNVKNDGASKEFNHLDFSHCREMLDVSIFIYTANRK